MHDMFPFLDFELLFLPVGKTGDFAILFYNLFDDQLIGVNDMS